MAMDSGHERRSIVDWDEVEVHMWLSGIGYPQYENHIKEHRISGDILALLDADGLKEIGISTIGQRLAILKAVYQAKIADNIPIQPDDYVPPSEAQEAHNITMDQLYDIVKEQSERLRRVEEDNLRLSECLQQCVEEITKASQGRAPTDDRNGGLQKQPSFRWAQYGKQARSPTKPETAVHTESPQPSPQRPEHDTSLRPPPPPSSQHSGSDRLGASYRSQNAGNTSSELGNAQVAGSSSNRQPKDTPNMGSTPSDLKSFKVSLDDPAWKVLPAALKKYKINNDDWQNYAMFICYGTTERCLSYDEKPLLLFQKLKDAKKNPVFMLKHIKDIRSPIVVAQQKHAARKASEAASPPSAGSSRSHGHGQTGSISSRPTKLQVHGLNSANGAPPPNSALTAPSAWPDVMSPAIEHKDKMDEAGSDAKRLKAGMAGTAATSEDALDGSASAGPSNAKEGAVAINGVSYAVAIYPYVAEQEDEYDVVVGDTFVILSRARGWWVVQRDPTGSGIVDTDTSKQGWVPAGCLLETNVPVASAIAEANALRSSSGEPPSSPASKTPILPLNILSTSFPGIALMDYRKKGEEELDLVKDDLVRVFKRYNHWSYAVKEVGGDRGWVPSWFIGKVNTGVPQTPGPTATTNGAPIAQVSLDSDFRYASEAGGNGHAHANNIQMSQISPMSSAFPPVR